MLVLRAVLDLGQVGRDRHHHPEDGRDDGQRAEADQDREQPQLADLGLAPAPVATGAAAVAAAARTGSALAGSRGGAGVVVVVAHAIEGRRRRCRPWRHAGAGARMTAAERHDGRTRASPGGGESLSIGPHEPTPAPPRRRRRRAGAGWRATRSTACPRAALARQARRGAPAAGQARASTRPRPTSTSATRSSCRSCASSRTSATRVVLIIGDYTARVGDPSGRSSTAAGARRPRRSTPTRAPSRSRRCKVLDPIRAARGALQRRVARHVDGRAVRADAHDDRRPAARARRLRQALRRARADLGARAALSAAAGL